MPRRAGRLVIPVLSLVVVVALTMGSASAEIYRHRDAVRDVWHDSYGKVKVVKSDRVGDIKRLKVRLGKEKLVLRVWYRKISAKGTLNQIWWFKGTSGVYGAEYTLADRRVTMLDGAGTYPTCKGSSVKVDATRDTTTATIPVSCLSSPSRIKVAAQFKGYFFNKSPRYVSYDLGLVKGVGGSKTTYSRWIDAG